MKIKLLVTISILAAVLQVGPGALAAKSPDSGGKHNERRLANLSPDERQKLQTAHEKAMQDPAVQSAHEKMRQARKEFRSATHAAMLKADPSIQPILDKIPKHGKKGGNDQD